MPEERIAQLENEIRELKTVMSMLMYSDRYFFSRDIQIDNGRNIQLSTGTGTRFGTGTSQRMGFFNATPVIQQTTTSQTPSTFVANTSGIVDDTATWAGYTIGDIVAILRAFGFIA